MYSEDDLLPISALQHLLFCERQTALIHIERQWEDNRFTAEGNVLHKKADAAKSETRDGVRITRGLPVHSFQLGLFGVCDVVQFQPPDSQQQNQLSLPKRIESELQLVLRRRPDHHGTDGNEVCAEVGSGNVMAPFAKWTITPIEYKRGKPKSNDCDRVQLCAQAMSLEEMLSVQIGRGDLFYGKQQRRTEVIFDEQLRTTTIDTTKRLHQLIRSRLTPTAVKENKCDTCSLLSVCMPPSPKRKSASQYLKTMLSE
ncbi:MAG: CRISPR-associated protein Cas4 [Fuerstiella sp.]